MPRRLSPALLVVMSLSVLPVPGVARADFAFIDAYVAREMRSAHIPGMALAIVRDAKTVHLKGFGRADSDGRIVTPQTSFILGSLSKSFTALAVMQLAEAGQLSLDAPVQRYLAWFRVADSEASSRITVRHLLYQRSGLSWSAGLPSSIEVPRELEGRVRPLASQALIAPPGTRFEYSNANYWVLGLIVEAAAREQFGAYVRHHIFEPLGMRNSFVSEQAVAEAGLAGGHQLWFGLPIPVRFPYYESDLPAGSIISSAEDMAQYLIAHLNGGRLRNATVLSPAGTAALHIPPDGSRYAMGWVVGERNGVRTVWHDGATGNYTAEMVLVPEGGWGLVLLTNAGNIPTSLTVNRTATGVMSLLVDRQPPEAAWPIRHVYLLANVVILLSTVLLARSVRKLRRLRQAIEGRRGGRAGIVRLALFPAAFQLALGSGLVIGIPVLAGVPVVALFLAQPDLMAWLVISGVVLFGAGAAKAVIGIRTMRAAGPLRSRVTDGDA